MDAIKKQASKLRDQISKQQQAVLRHLQNLGNQSLLDDTEIQCQHHLEKLYNSTRAARHFQRDIARSLNGFILVGKRQTEIVRKLAEDCQNYGSQNQIPDSPLARGAAYFGTSHGSLEDEREIMLKILVDQVYAPLRASIAGAPLEDARLLTHRYDKLRQEVETQAFEVLKCQSRCKDPSEENIMKLKNAEARLGELKNSMTVLGREATSAMLAVEDNQQQITYYKLLTMVETERSYHQKVVSVLEELHDVMILETQLGESCERSVDVKQDMHIPTIEADASSNGSDCPEYKNSNGMVFVAKVLHSFDAETDSELSLEVDDYVIVRQVAPDGWSEGECKGKAGWFPSAYVKRQDKVLATKITGTHSSQ